MNVKKLTAFVTCLVLSLCCFALAACGGGEQEDNVNKDYYVMEAEYIDLDDVNGAGISSDQKGVDMIYGDGTDAQKKLGWSNGYFVGYTYATDLELTFVFEASEATKATIVLRLGSELGDIALDTSNFAISLNGKNVRYRGFSIEGSTIEAMKFTDCTVSTSASLKKGENVLTLKILENDIKSGKTGGPTVDCVKIKTEAKLTWTDKTENPSKRGSLV